MAKKKRTRKASQTKRQMLLLILVLAVVAGIVITGHVFTLKDVRVIGNTTYSANDIARMAQLPFGENILMVDVEGIGTNFLGSGYVEFLSARRILPDTIELTVRERTPRAMINYLGVSLVIDEKGYIMEQRSDVPDLDVMTVTGVKLNTFQVGLKVTSTVPNQIETISTVLSAIYQSNSQSLLSELNVNDLDNLYVMARSGVQVMLGDANNLDTKLNTMRYMLDQLAAEGKLTGVIYISGNPDQPSAVHDPS